MSSNLFEVEVDGSEVVAVLRGMGARADDLAPVFDVIAEDLVTAVVDRIDSRGDGEWDDNADSTIAKKGSSAPMIDDGVLRGSIRAESGNDFAMASTDVAYIVYSLDGGPVIPQRNPFTIQDAYYDEAARMIAEAIATGGSRAA